MEVITQSPQETKELGQKIANKLKTNLICLYGRLGSGKTTFVQGFAKGLRIKKRIISPTFIIIREYEIPQTQTNFYHVDLFRAKDEKDAKGIGLLELWQDKKNLIIIEWADRARRILPKNRLDIYFEYLEEKKRKIVINHQSLTIIHDSLHRHLR